MSVWQKLGRTLARVGESRELKPDKTFLRPPTQQYDTVELDSCDAFCHINNRCSVQWQAKTLFFTWDIYEELSLAQDP